MRKTTGHNGVKRAIKAKLDKSLKSRLETATSKLPALKAELVPAAPKETAFAPPSGNAAIAAPRMAVIVSRQELQTALLFAGKDDSRPTLCSVCIEVQPRSNKPNIIATDGRRLAVIQSQAEQPEGYDNSATVQMLLTSAFVKAICALSKAIGGKIFPWIQFANTPGSSQVFVELIGGNCSLNTDDGALVEGEFPNWRSCVPSKKLERTQISDLGINAEFVGDFAKAAKIFDLNPVIQINLIAKESALEVKLSGADYFYGLIMPCTPNEEENYQPEFLGIVEGLPVKVEAPKETEEA